MLQAEEAAAPIPPQGDLTETSDIRIKYAHAAQCGRSDLCHDCCEGALIEVKNTGIRSHMCLKVVIEAYKWIYITI